MMMSFKPYLFILVFFLTSLVIVFQNITPLTPLGIERDGVLSVKTSSHCPLGDFPGVLPPPEPPVDCSALGLARRTKPAVIIDYTILGIDDKILALRLGTLGSVVDHFAIAEFSRDFAGAPKSPAFFPIQDCFAIWKNKILHHYHNISWPWALWENFQRDRPNVWMEHLMRHHTANPLISEIISHHRRAGNAAWDEDENIILAVSDTDEIATPRSYAILKQCSGMTIPSRMWFDFFYYSFKWKKKSKWLGTVFLPVAEMNKGRGDGLSVANWKYYEHLSSEESKEAALLYNGYHMSYFLSPTKILKKLTTWSKMASYLTAPALTLEWVLHCFETGEDILARGETEQLIKVDCTNKSEAPELVTLNPQFFNYCPQGSHARNNSFSSVG